MAWGARSRGVDDLVAQLRRQCTSNTMALMKNREFGEPASETFFEALGLNTSLKTLLLAGHTLSPLSARRLGAALAVNHTLEKLSLGDRNFGDAGLEGLILGGFQANRGLKSLDLEFRALGAASALALGQLLGSAAEGCPPLTEILLSRNCLAEDHEAFATLMRGVALHSHVTNLDLAENSGNGQADIAAAHLALLSGQRTLSTLILSDNAWGPSAPIGHLLTGLPNLRELFLENCSLGDEGGAAVAAALGKAPALVELHLGGNRLGPSAAAAIGSALSTATPLRVLKLSSNDFGDEGAVAIAVVAAVAVLDVSRNGITAAGAAVLLATAASPLEELVLLGNSLGICVEGVDTVDPRLAESLSGSSIKLQVLDLTGCGLTEHGLGSLLDACVARSERSGGALRSLMVGGNKLGAAGRAALDAIRDASGIDVACDVETEEGDPDGGRGGATVASASSPADMATGQLAEAQAEAEPPQWIGLPPPPPEPAAAEEDACPFPVGSPVAIFGLASAAASKYNGQRGIVSSGIVNGRLTVWVDEYQKAINVKPANLRADCAAD